ncbi:MAG: YicC family protein [Flavobacteriales bacterium]|nr:YicC family protein [Flavobacteriales bacterium]
MLQSMTGFGKATGHYGNNTCTVEVRSVNSKQLDLNMRMPSAFREREPELRRMVSEGAVRGKVDLSINIEGLEEGRMQQLNHVLFDHYYSELGKAATEKGLSKDGLLSEILRLPDVMQPLKLEMRDTDWPEVRNITAEAILAFQRFREAEGTTLAKELRARVEGIHLLMEQVTPFEPERVATVRQRLQERLDEISTQKDLDPSRLEHELVFFIEKYDVTEEKVRLSAHCHYFIETMETDPQAGRKLGFIAQEMGREINTLGSKANHAEIQKLVVQMKDELEKVKEQVLNVL